MIVASLVPKPSRLCNFLWSFNMSTTDDPTWEGRNTAAPLGPPDDWGAQDIPESGPEGKPAAVPSRGVPGSGGDTSGDAGALHAPARPRHRGDPGGGQPPPTTVPPMRPPGPKAGAKWAAPGDRTYNFPGRI